MERLIENLDKMGHRNWIVVVDAGYSWLANHGVETSLTDLDALSVVNRALAAVKKAKHVRAEVLLDAELEHLNATDAPGAAAYRKELAAILQGLAVRRNPHDRNIELMHETASRYRVQVIKTTTTIPYAAVYIELHSGYWSPEAEQRLRALLPKET